MRGNGSPQWSIRGNHVRARWVPLSGLAHLFRSLERSFSRQRGVLDSQPLTIWQAEAIIRAHSWLKDPFQRPFWNQQLSRDFGRNLVYCVPAPEASPRILLHSLFVRYELGVF